MFYDTKYTIYIGSVILIYDNSFKKSIAKKHLFKVFFNFNYTSYSVTDDIWCGIFWKIY